VSRARFYHGQIPWALALLEDEGEFVAHLCEFTVDSGVIGGDFSFVGCAEGFEHNGELVAFASDGVGRRPVRSLIGSMAEGVSSLPVHVPSMSVGAAGFGVCAAA